jgi:hypothetical protein
MKCKRRHIPAGHSYTVLKQVCNLIPGGLVNRLAEMYGVAEQSRTFSPWSHVVAQVHAQLTHAIGLNDVCDSLRMNEGVLATIRGATPPSRNNLSHANKVRDCALAEALYWETMAHLMRQTPGFAKGKVRRGFLASFPQDDPRLGLHDHSTGGQLHGLGQTSTTESRRQMPPAAEPAELPARVRHHRHRQRARLPQGPRRSAPAWNPAKSPCLTRPTWTTSTCKR